MKKLRRAWNRLVGCLPGGRRDAELAEELEAHVAMLTEENLRRGMSPSEARRQALVTFGGLASAMESYRDQMGLPAIDSLRQDPGSGESWWRTRRTGVTSERDTWFFLRRGKLITVAFDLERLETMGQPTPLGADMMQTLGHPVDEFKTASGQYAVSDAGWLAYVSGSIFPDFENSLVRLDWKGNVSNRRRTSPRLSSLPASRPRGIGSLTRQPEGTGERGSTI